MNELPFNNIQEVEQQFIVPEFPIIDYQPMLASIIQLDKLRFPLYIQPKYDGIRCVHYNHSYTRMLKPIPNILVQQELHKVLPKDTLFDGELISGNFSTTQSIVMSNRDSRPFIYYIFDILVQKKYDLSFELRYKVLKANLLHINNPCIKIVPTYLVHNTQELFEYHDKFIKQGYEGTMLRDPSGIYKTGRSTVKQQYLLKLKNFQDDEATIVGFTEKYSNTNIQEIDERGYSKRSSKQEGLIPMNTLGSLIVITSEGIEFEVGTGFNDEQRQEIWDNQSQYLNKQITFKYQGYGSKGKPRFPVFKAFRSEN